MLKQTKPIAQITTITTSTTSPNKSRNKRIRIEKIKSERIEPDESTLTEVPLQITLPVFKSENVDARVPNLKDAMTHLCLTDARFESLFQRFIPQPWTETGLREPKNHFKSLVLSVISQQVSGAAARSIGRRFVGLFRENLPDILTDVDIDPEVEDGPAAKQEVKGEIDEKPEVPSTGSAPANDALMDGFFPTPEQVASSDVLYLKSAGLSLRKAEYVQGIALAFLRGDLNDEFFAQADDESIKQRLTDLRGLGPWSAEMFMVHDYVRFSS